MLICSTFIGFCVWFHLISQTECFLTYLMEAITLKRSIYLRFLFKYNLEMFYPFHQRWCFQESSLSFFAGTQHVQEALCNILREYSTNHPHGHSFQFHETHDNSSSKKQNSDLISKGITSPWVEYNDGCAWGCGIHSLLFVIYYF